MALQADVQAMVDEVARNTSVVASVKALIDKFINTVQPAIDAEDLTAIQDAVNSLKANDDELASAVAANTPAETPPADTPPADTSGGDQPTS